MEFVTHDEAQRISSATMSDMTEWLQPNQRPRAALPLGVLDQMLGTLYVPQAFCFRETLDAAALKRSLVATLDRIPVLTGRLAVAPGGRWEVRSQGRGVPFTTAASAIRWAEWGVDAPLGRALGGLFHPTVSLRSERRDAPLLTVRLNLLRGGGSILGVAVHHAIADAASIGLFMRTWSALHRGHPPPAIDLDRLALEARLLACPAEPAGEAAPRVEPATRRRVFTSGARLALALVRSESLFVDLPAGPLAEARRALERVLAGEGEASRLSAHDVATAALWSMLERVRPTGVARSASVIVDLRQRLTPRIDPGYFGNACVAILKRPATDGRPARRAASIRTTLLALRDGHAAANVQSTHATIFGPRSPLPEVVDALAHGGFMFNSWARNGAYEVDFGAGPPTWFEPPGMSVSGLVLFMPSPRADGSLVARISLERGALAALRRRFGAAIGPGILDAASSGSTSLCCRNVTPRRSGR